MQAATLNIHNGAGQLSGDLTFATVSDLHKQMQTSNKIPQSIDLTHVERIDSAGLALLLEWQSAFREQTNSTALISMSNPPSALISIAQLCDAGEFLTGDSGTE